MLRVSRAALSTTAGVLLIGGCGGSPMYAEQDVMTVDAPASPAPPSEHVTPSASPAQSSRSSAPSSRNPPSSPTESTSTPPPQASSTEAPSSTGAPSSKESTQPSTTPEPSSPSTSEPSPPSPTTTAPTGARPTTLDALGGPGSGPIGIAGTRYPNSFAVSACTVFSTQPSYDFPLKKRYDQLTAVVGQDDGSTSKQARLRLIVRGDGRTLAERTVQYGQRVPLSVDIRGVQTLVLDFSEVDCGSEGAALAVGHPRVS